MYPANLSRLHPKTRAILGLSLALVFSIFIIWYLHANIKPHQGQATATMSYVDSSDPSCETNYCTYTYAATFSVKGQTYTTGDREYTANTGNDPNLTPARMAIYAPKVGHTFTISYNTQDPNDTTYQNLTPPKYTILWSLLMSTIVVLGILAGVLNFRLIKKKR